MANSTSIVSPMVANRFEIPVVATIRRSNGCRPTNDRPSPISAINRRRAALGTRVSRCLIRRVNTTAPRNETASIRMTSGAAERPDEHAAQPWTVTSAADCETCSLALPSLIRAAGTRDGNRLW